jgi:riboflavin synthase
VFSGLVEAVGRLRSRTPRSGGARLEVECALAGEPLRHGESVAVNGVCLTVAASGAHGFAADLSPETLSRTTLGRVPVGGRVNVERALRVTDRLGGHIVLGHVDATAAVRAVQLLEAFRVLRVALPPALAPEVAEKGSVAVDGVSLTVAAVGGDWFEVAVIPATLEGTTLKDRRVGDLVNLETDVLAKYVRRALGEGRASLETLLAGWGHAEG